MNKKQYKNVDAYIKDQSPEAQQVLEDLRKTVQSTVPKAEETLRWSAPFYKYHGFLAGYAAYKKHARFGIVGTEIDKDTRKKLESKGYTVLERAVQIQYGQKVPKTEIKQLLKEKAKENRTEERVH